MCNVFCYELHVICLFFLLSVFLIIIIIIITFFPFFFFAFLQGATSNKSYVKIFEKEDNTKRYEIDTMSQV